jgi:hypothetical protein
MIFLACAPVSSKTHNLYRLAGFNDANDNGVVEDVGKPSIGNLWNLFRNEGYNPVADIDGDKRIIEAEAKYYIRTCKDIRPEIKQRVTITEKEIDALLSLSEAIDVTETDSRGNVSSDWREANRKAEVMMNIAVEAAKIGLHKKAVEIARSIGTKSYEYFGGNYRILALIYIASEISKTNPNKSITIFKEAMKRLRSEHLAVGGAHYHDKFGLIRIATREMIKAGFIEEALKIAREDYKSPDSLSYIALEMHRAGVDQNKVKAIFMEAKKGAIGNDWYAYNIRGYIASGMAKAGLFEDAVEIPRDIHDTQIRRDFLLVLAFEAVKAGKDESELVNLFMTALKDEDPGYYLQPCVNYIATGMAEAGLSMGKIKEFIIKLEKELNAKFYDDAFLRAAGVKVNFSVDSKSINPDYIKSNRYFSI